MLFRSDNTAFWGPLSWTMIFGLAFATFLTLILVPVMTLLAERLKRKSENVLDQLNLPHFLMYVPFFVLISGWVLKGQGKTIVYEKGDLVETPKNTSTASDDLIEQSFITNK